MLDRTMAQRAPLLWILIPLMLGLSAGKAVPFPVPVSVLLVAAVGLAWVAIRAERTAIWSVSLGASVACSGLALYDLTRARLPAWENLPPREARLQVEVSRIFAPGKDPRKIGGLGTIRHAPDHLKDLLGQRVYFSGRLPNSGPRPISSASIELVGRLERLAKSPPANTFDGYLAAAGMNFKVSRGRIIRQTVAPTTHRAFCDAAQTRMSQILGFGLEAHPELAGVSRAMLLGQGHELSEEQDAWFTQTGTLHLFSISGLHIGVIAVAVSGLLTVLRLPHWPRFILSISILWLYVDVTGRAPSAIRAFLMIFLLQASFVLRRPRSTVSALVTSAVLVLVFDPMQLFSASFQMSYGIVAALLVMGLPLGESWEGRWMPFRALPPTSWNWVHRWILAGLRGTLGALAIGVSTALVSTVTGVLYFQLFTPGALLANLALIPVASLALLAGFASLLVGLPGAMQLSVVFNHAAALVLWVVERSLAWFADLPGVHFPAAFHHPTVGYGVLAGLLALLFGGFHAGWARRVGGFWPPVVYSILVLILLVSFEPVP